MLKVKNRTSQPIQIPLRSRDHRSIETIVLGSKSEATIDEEFTTVMFDRLVKKGLLRVTKIV